MGFEDCIVLLYYKINYNTLYRLKKYTKYIYIYKYMLSCEIRNKFMLFSKILGNFHS